MPEDRYPVETLTLDEDDGTMTENVHELADALIGHRIVNVARIARDGNKQLRLTLDTDRTVILIDSYDCCAETTLLNVLTNLDLINHMILGVGTTDGYETRHIYCDLGDVLQVSVSWSCGNPFYYGYGFRIRVVEESTETE